MTELQNKIVRLRAQGFGYKKISKELNISKNTVASFCRRNSLDGFAGEGIIRCKNCGKKLSYSGIGRKPSFCCQSCKQEWRKICND